MATIRETLEHDLYVIAPNMREADRDEVWAAAGHTPLQALRTARKLSSPCLTAVADGTEEPLCMFGVVPSSDPTWGAVWLLGSDSLFDHPRELMRLSRAWLREETKERILSNFVDCRNKVHIRWLERMGATFHETIPAYGYEGLPFIRFELCANPQLS